MAVVGKITETLAELEQWVADTTAIAHEAAATTAAKDR